MPSTHSTSTSSSTAAAALGSPVAGSELDAGIVRRSTETLTRLAAGLVLRHLRAHAPQAPASLAAGLATVNPWTGSGGEEGGPYEMMGQ